MFEKPAPNSSFHVSLKITHLMFTEGGQKLYVRLFGRNFKWITKSKIKYPKIAEDLSDTLAELVSCGLLLDGTVVFFFVPY